MDPDDDRPSTSVVELTVDDADVDVASGELWAAGAVAVGEVDEGGRTVLRAATADGDPAPLVAAVRAWGPRATGGPPEIRTVAVAAEEGLDAWRAHARSWRAGRHLVVTAPWVDGPAASGTSAADDDDVVLAIDPGHAFGSGSHVSTRLALAALEPRVAPGASVADVGCGSGVLGIAAARLGAARVRAADVDPAAVAATQANAERNGVADRVAVALGSVGAVGRGHDLVAANLLAPVLRALGPELAAALGPDGRLVLAGLLAGQVDGVVAATGLIVVDRLDDEGWTALVLAAGAPGSGAPLSG